MLVWFILRDQNSALKETEWVIYGLLLVKINYQTESTLTGDFTTIIMLHKMQLLMLQQLLKLRGFSGFYLMVQ
jgi:hypothetical protein